MNAILLTDMASVMANAGVNTLLGMGTVFTVLILIMCVIYSFNLFNGSKKPAKVEEKKTSVDNAVAQIAANEEASDDTELVAVIAAVIAAYEGSSSTDGYVVRSIRRVR